MYQHNQIHAATQAMGAIAGAGLGPEVRQQPPAIALAMEQLEREIHTLREGIQRLEQRLSPVVRPVPQCGQKEMLSDGGSPLCSQVNAYAQLIRSASADVYMLLDCLEL